MNLSDLSIRRPIFVTCLFIVILGLGVIARSHLGISLYPNVSFPIVNVVVPYPGAGPQEIETQVSKPIEDALGELSGIRTLRSISLDGVATVTAVFGFDTDIRFAEQKVAQSISRIRGELPRDILDPRIRSVDPTETPVLTLSLRADVPEAQLYDLADRDVRPLIEQAPEVGLVEILGGRKREVQVELDERKLKAHEISASEIVGRLSASGLNAPLGRIETDRTNWVVRSTGQFKSLPEIANTVIRFVGNESAVPLNQLGSVRDGLEDEKTRVYVNGKRALILRVFRQSGGNTVAVADEVAKRIQTINAELKPRVRGFELSIARDGSKPIRDGVKDATESIEFGIALTILVVLLFLRNIRSTVITGLALPNSLLGVFILMWIFGFTVNITTLAALSLAVGLLIDDAIVVRENIFRRIQSGESPSIAAAQGTQEVTLAVVATTMTVLSVFAPISFLKGIIGQFFQQFGLTTCFAMLISLLDSLTIAPMLSAHFGGTGRERNTHRLRDLTERLYLRMLGASLRHPLKVLMLATAIFGLSFPVLLRLPKSFVPPTGAGEFLVRLEGLPGTALNTTDRQANDVDSRIHAHPEVKETLLTVGGEHGETHQAEIVVRLQESGNRKLRTDEVKELIRKDLRAFPLVNSKIQDILDIGGGAGQPYVLHLTGEDIDQLKTASDSLVKELRKETDLKDVDSSYRIGSPELQVALDAKKMDALGVSSGQVAQELRILIAGSAPAQFRESGKDYDIRIRLREDQRDLRTSFSSISVPNLNSRLMPLSDVSRLISTAGPSAIYRENRRRFIEISADVNPQGKGLAHAMDTTRSLLDSGRIPMPPGVRYEFAGQTRDFQDLLESVTLALGVSIGFMYLILATLYESFFIPLAILLVLPLAICGAFYALAVTYSALNIYSMLGCILLLGVAAKNSILLVDSIHKGVKQGKELSVAILRAGRIRLRPILMTSFALIAGMLPVAIPHEESASSRAGMAIAVIGGLISSTLLTLIVVPAAYGYIERLQQWVLRQLRRVK